MDSPISSKPFTLSEDVGPEHYMTLAKIRHESFLSDVQTKLKEFDLPQQPISVEDIRQKLAKPQSCSVIKAVSAETNEVMGWVCWGHRGYILRPPRPEETTGRLTDQSSTSRTKIQHLEDLTDSHFAQFMTDIMPEGTKCWYIIELNVAPKYQGMGVGRALIEWGTRKAEKDGVFAWVHSSEMAWKAYRACGFEVVRELRLDLDDYVDGGALGHGPGVGGHWGIYTFKYMVYARERAPNLLTCRPRDI